MALYIVSGKGGVGKTHLSLSLAYHLTQKGKKTLLVEFSGSSQYSDFFDKDVNFTNTEFDENLYLASWNGLDCLEEYAGKVLGSKKLVSLFMSNQIMKNLMRVAPGLREIAVLGKATSTFRNSGFKEDYTDIILDAPSSGHFLSLLGVPFGLLKAVKSGPMASQCRSIIDTVKNKELTKIILVSLEKELSLNETNETEEKVESLIGFKPTRVLNKTLNRNVENCFPEIKKICRVLQGRSIKNKMFNTVIFKMVHKLIKGSKLLRHS